MPEQAHLFGFPLEDYDSLFAEKLDLLLKIRESEHVHWSGKHRVALTGQGVYPETRAKSLADMAGCWWDRAIVPTRGRAGTAAHGRYHRR